MYLIEAFFDISNIVYLSCSVRFIVFLTTKICKGNPFV